MSSTELINLYSIISATISPVIFSISTLSKVIALRIFTKHKNLLLTTSDLATNSHITTNNAQTIWIHDQAFVSLSDA